MSEYLISCDSIEQPMSAEFKPQPDITAYELAILLPYFLGKALYRKQFDEMPENARRHLIEKAR